MPAPHFPTEPVPPAEFLEQYLHGVLAHVEALEAARDVFAEVGLQLLGEGGGEWVLTLSEGRLGVRAGPRDDTPASFVQRVADFRGAIWEGQGAALGRAMEGWFRAPVSASDGGAGLRAAAPKALKALGKLDGLLRLEVTVENGEPWQLDLKLGPGGVPGEPTTTLSVDGADADRMLSGALNPLEAFLSGRIRLRGDLGMLLQLQIAGRKVGRAVGRAGRRS